MWQKSINVENWRDAVSRVLCVPDAGPSSPAATCARGQGTKRRHFIRYRHLAGSAFLREEDARSFLFQTVLPAQLIASDCWPLREVSSESGCTGGALVRNRTRVSRVSVRRCIEIRGFQRRIYFAYRGNAINPCAVSGMRPFFVHVSAFVPCVCPCYCMSTRGDRVIRRNISSIRV